MGDLLKRWSYNSRNLGTVSLKRLGGKIGPKLVSFVLVVEMVFVCVCVCERERVCLIECVFVCAEILVYIS